MFTQVVSIVARIDHYGIFGESEPIEFSQEFSYVLVDGFESAEHAKVGCDRLGIDWLDALIILVNRWGAEVGNSSC